MPMTINNTLDVDVYKNQITDFLEQYESKDTSVAIFNSIVAEIKVKQKRLEDFSKEDWQDFFNKKDMQQSTFVKTKYIISAFLKMYNYTEANKSLTEVENTKVPKYYTSIEELLDMVYSKMKLDERFNNYCCANGCTDKLFVSTKYSPAICMVFLLWLGLTIKECAELEKSDVDLINKTLTVNGRVVDFSVNEKISKFIEWYYKQDEVYLFYHNKVRIYELTSDYLIRSFKGGYPENQIGKLLTIIIGIKADVIYNSKLYSQMLEAFTSNGLEVNQSNATSFIASKGIGQYAARNKAADFVKAYNANNK